MKIKSNFIIILKHIARNIIFNFSLCSHLQWPNHSYKRFHSLSEEEYEIIYNNRCGNEREMGCFSWNCSKRDYNFVSYVGLGEVCSMHRSGSRNWTRLYIFVYAKVKRIGKYWGKNLKGNTLPIVCGISPIIYLFSELCTNTMPLVST